MNNATKIIIAVVAIVIIVVGIAAAAYYGANSNSPSPTPTPSSSTSPTESPTSSPTGSPTSGPSTSPTATPTATPTPTLASNLQLYGSGGTLVQPLMNEWIVAYNQYQPKVQVSYGGGGSGKGISDFQTGLNNFGESDAPLQAADIGGLPPGSVALTIPIAASGVVPAYKITLVNGTAMTNGLNFTGTVLSGIFNGTITTWNDNAIKALQSSSVAAQLPNQAIKVITRSDSSGTTFVFTDYLSQVSPASWTKSKTPLATVTGVGTGYSGNGGVAAGIAATEGSIGYLEIAYELQNPSQISYGTVQNAAGNYILANVSNIQASLAAGATSFPAGNQTWSSVSVIDNIYNDKTDTGIYPIVTLTYALVYQTQSNYNTGTALVSFFTWVINQGQSYSATIGYVPLPSNIVAIDTATIKLISYNGNQIPLLS